MIISRRRVRTAPGGTSSLSNFWDPAEAETFKPTRRYVLDYILETCVKTVRQRVRQGPGGQDNIDQVILLS